MSKSHFPKALQAFVLFMAMPLPALCQMVYNVSVYTDATWDGSTLFATSTTVDSSTGCYAHGSYSTTARLIAPDGTQASSTSGGMVANTSKSINGQTTGTWYAMGTVQFYCGCFGQWVGGGGFSVPLSFAITYTQSRSVMSDGNGMCAQLNGCTNGSPKCPVSSIKEGWGVVPCHVYHECLSLVLVGICDFIAICPPAGGPGICTL